MDELNRLLNKVLGSKEVNYTDGVDNLNKCRETFRKSLGEDEIKLKVFFYFFPNSKQEQNSTNFWFIKYKNEEPYNEYNFSIDLLKCYDEYLTDKNSKNFDSKIRVAAEKFKSYKYFNQFFEVTEKYVDILMAIKAYFTKDIIYFQETFDLITMDEKIQTPTFIQKIIKSLNNKKIVVDLMNRINDMEKCNQKLFENLEKLNQANSAKIISLQKDNLTLKENNKNLNRTITDLKNDLKNLKEDNDEKIKILDSEIKSLKNRLDQIDLRDTIKMSFNYLYKILHKKHGGEYSKNFWEQIEKIKDMLNYSEYNNKYEFVIKFINDMQFNRLSPLNQEAHDSDKKRQIEDIKKYLQGFSDDDLNKIVAFFNKFPFIEDFITLHLKFYFNPTKADDEFQQKVKYEIAYNQIFGQ